MNSAIRIGISMSAAVTVAALVAAVPLDAGEPVYTYHIDGPERLEGPPGGIASALYDVIITPAGDHGGVEALGYEIALGVKSEGAQIVEIVTSGTASGSTEDEPPGLVDETSGGHVIARLTDGEGNEGGAIAVILTFDASGVGLPTEHPSIGARVRVEANVPQAGVSTVQLEFAQRFWGNVGFGNSLVLRDNTSIDAIASEETIEIGVGAPFLRGDANLDGALDVSDAAFMLRALFGGGRQPACEDAADTNDSGVFDISDPIALFNFLFSGSAPPPPEPGPSGCDVDPTADPLLCGESGPCV